MRTHRRATGRRNPGLKQRTRQDADTASRQAQALPGMPRPDKHQARLDAWQAGADDIERKMMPWRSAMHHFEPIGCLPACLLCGLARNQLHDGKPVHFPPKPEEA